MNYGTYLALMAVIMTPLCVMIYRVFGSANKAKELDDAPKSVPDSTDKT